MIHTHNRLLFVDFLRFVLFIVLCVCICVLSAPQCVVTIILHTHKSGGERPTSSARHQQTSPLTACVYNSTQLSLDKKLKKKYKYVSWSSVFRAELMTAELCNFRENLSSTPIAVTRRIKRVVVTNRYASSYRCRAVIYGNR